MSRNLLHELFADSVIDVSAAGVLRGSTTSPSPAQEATTVVPQSDGSPTGPTLWQKAQSVTVAVAKFAAGGMRTVSPELQQARLEVCKGCERYNGSLCNVCGCLISSKSWFPAENCPQGKWPLPGQIKQG